MAEEETQTTEASQEGSVSFEDLDRAAEGLSGEPGGNVADSDDNAADGDVGTQEGDAGDAGDGVDDNTGDGADVVEGEAEGEGEGDVKIEPDDNAERSKLGRKVKSLEDTLQTLMEKLDQTIASPKPDSDELADEDDFDIPTTKEEFVKLVEEYEREKGTKVKQYESGYIQKVNELWADEEEDVQKEIEEELLKNFNKKYSDDPERDAEINYLKAERSYLKKINSALKTDKPKVNPLKGEGKPAPVGGASESRRAQEPSVKLDPFAEAFRQSVGMSDDIVREVLGK